MLKQRSNNTGITAEIIKIDDIAQIMERGVMLLPAVVIDGDMKVSWQDRPCA